MKKALIFTLLSAFTCGAVFAADNAPATANNKGDAVQTVGQVPTGEGKIFSNDAFMVVRKDFDPAHPMKRHNHPSAKIVLTVVKGKATFTLNDTEKHELQSGGVLIFDGDNFINGDFAEPTTLVITLVEKEKK